MSTLDGKVALVTGGSRGIGRAVSERLAGAGALVAVHYGSNEQAARDTVAAIEASGGSAFAVRAELGVDGDVATLFGALDAELGERTGSAGLDIVVANAGIAEPAPFVETTPDLYDRHFAVNTRAPFFLLQAAVPRLRDGARIVTVSTGLTKRAEPNLVAYTMTKGALDALTMALAKELGPRGIRVNSVAPGVIDTDMNGFWLRGSDEVRADTAALSPFNRLADARDVADIVAFLVSDDARWVTGEFVDASGGALM